MKKLKENNGRNERKKLKLKQNLTKKMEEKMESVRRKKKKNFFLVLVDSCQPSSTTRSLIW